jgi:hypothetical protein
MNAINCPDDPVILALTVFVLIIEIAAVIKVI